MGLFQNIFRKKTTILSKEAIKELQLNEFEAANINKFINSTDADKLKQVIVLGETGGSENYKLIKYCILYDPDLNVKFAALKRIHLFKDHPDRIDFLKTLSNKMNTKNLEPYYSMALSKMGIISIEEFKAIFDK